MNPTQSFSQYFNTNQRHHSCGTDAGLCVVAQSLPSVSATHGRALSVQAGPLPHPLGASYPVRPLCQCVTSLQPSQLQRWCWFARGGCTMAVQCGCWIWQVAVTNVGAATHGRAHAVQAGLLSHTIGASNPIRPFARCVNKKCTNITAVALMLVCTCLRNRCPACLLASVCECRAS